MEERRINLQDPGLFHFLLNKVPHNSVSILYFDDDAFYLHLRIRKEEVKVGLVWWWFPFL